MAWEKVKISSFLKERESRIKPEEANKMGLKRLNKIDFSGEIHLTDKPTNTDMILIKHGDLVISGINVEKGAVAVYQGDEDILATIHYSAYIFDETKIDIEYFKTFLKSKAFMDVINSQIRSGIKTELKAKTLLNLEIHLPDLEAQLKIRDKLNLASGKISELDTLNSKNEIYITKLREAILSEAVQGKLVQQNKQDEPASILLKKIKAEKEKLIKEGKIRKEKPLAPISDDEKPYALPQGWEWVRLGDVCEINPRNCLKDELEVAFIPMTLIEDGFQNKHLQEIRRWSEIKLGFTHFAEDDVVFAKITPCFQNRKSAILRNLKNKYGAGTTELVVLRSYARTILPEILLYLVKTEDFITKGVTSYTGTAGQQRIKREFYENLVIGLPPLPEQSRIVEKVDKLMAYCDELEKQVKENQQNSEKLMGAVLKDSFENDQGPLSA